MRGGGSVGCYYTHPVNNGTFQGGDGGDGMVPGRPNVPSYAGTRVVPGSYGENMYIYSLRDRLGATLTTVSLTNHVLTLNDDVAGPIWIPPVMGRLTVDLNGHSITGVSSQAEIADGAAIVVTGAFMDVSLPTTLLITGTGSIVGGVGAPGESGAPGIYVATEGVYGWDLLALGADVTVQGGAGGDSPTGGGGAGGAGVHYRSDPVAAETLKYYSMVSLTNEGTIRGGAGGAGATGGGAGGYGVDRRGVCLVNSTADLERLPFSRFRNVGTVVGGDGGVGGEGAAKPGVGGAGTYVLGYGDTSTGTIAPGAPGFCDLARVDNIYTNLVTVERMSTLAGDPREHVEVGMVGWTVAELSGNGYATAVRMVTGGVVGSTNGLARLTFGVVGSGTLSFGDIVRRPAAAGGTVDALAIRVDGREVRRFPAAAAVAAAGLRAADVDVVVSGDGNTNHVVVLEYEQTTSGSGARSVCSVGDVAWRSYYEMDDGGTTWLDTAVPAPVVIVDHEQAEPNVTHLAFMPQLKVPGELEYWIRRSAEKDAAGRSRICVKPGRTRRECTAATPIDAELRDFGAGVPRGARDLDKGFVWLTVRLPEDVVLPVGYWRVFLRPSQEAFGPEHAQRESGPTSFRVHYLEVGTGAVLAEPRTFTNQSVGALVHVPWYAVDVGRGYTLRNDPDECALLVLDPTLNEYVCWYDHPTTTTTTFRYMDGQVDIYTDIAAPLVTRDQTVGSQVFLRLDSAHRWIDNRWQPSSLTGGRRTLDWVEELNTVFFFFWQPM